MTGPRDWAYEHRASLRLADGADPQAPGARVTVALCGHWEHQPPCRWEHHTSATSNGELLQVSVGFDCGPGEEAEVRRRVREALAEGELEEPHGTSRWQLVE